MAFLDDFLNADVDRVGCFDYICEKESDLFCASSIILGKVLQAATCTRHGKITSFSAGDRNNNIPRAGLVYAYF
jgi:hypothetical protein